MISTLGYFLRVDSNGKYTTSDEDMRVLKFCYVGPYFLNHILRSAGLNILTSG